MDTNRLLAARMRSGLLNEPAQSIEAAATHMLAIQSQDFAAGRYALAQRSGTDTSKQQVDTLFNDGTLVRSWTMRGTLHICTAEDLRWLMRTTRERTLRALAPRLRESQVEAPTLDAASTILSEYLLVHGQASRAALFGVLNKQGIGTAAQRGLYILQALALNGLICQGPIPDDARLTAQDFVLVDQWIAKSHDPKMPLAELLHRYLLSHGPATIRDAAWYAGQTLTSMRSAAEALADTMLTVGRDEKGEDYWVITQSPAHQLLETTKPIDMPLRLLGPFDEYYLSYSNRTLVADKEMTRAILPAKNGTFLPFWLEQGRATRLWNAETAPTDKTGTTLHQQYIEFKTARKASQKP